MAAQWERQNARYAEVAVDAAVGPERTFTYEIPPRMQLFPGQPVFVPLLSRRVGGVVFALSETTDIQGIRPVLEPQHPEPVLAAPPARPRAMAQPRDPLHAVRGRRRHAPAGLPTPPRAPPEPPLARSPTARRRHPFRRRVPCPRAAGPPRPRAAGVGRAVAGGRGRPRPATPGANGACRRAVGAVAAGRAARVLAAPATRRHRR